MSRFGIGPQFGERTDRTRREYHGDRHNVTINPKSTFKWAPVWNRITQALSADCRAKLEELEPEVNAFGYSLLEPTKLMDAMYMSRKQFVDFK